MAHVLSRPPDVCQPTVEVLERENIGEAEVGEGRAVIAFAWGQKAESTAERVVVVVGREALQGALSLEEAPKQLAVEDLVLEDVPERLDLAIRPGRVDLSPKMVDSEVLQSLAEAGQHAGHPSNKGLAVVTHEVQRLPADRKSTRLNSSHQIT